MQRIRARFSRGEAVKYISHLDLTRMWQRAFVRGGIPLAYSEGFNPHPRISLAAPLPIGVTSDAELLDVYCSRDIPPAAFADAVRPQLPPAIGLLQVQSVPLTLPALQAAVRFAEYRVTPPPTPRLDIEAAIARLMAVDSLPWKHERDTGTRHYDLRKLIARLWLPEEGDGPIEMRLRCDSSGSGRPEQVLAAAGLGEPLAIHRTRLILEAA